jgi:hypothetical protein
MAVKIMIDLAPFSVPESVQLCIGGPTPGLTELFDFTSRPKLALSEIDADSLAALCDQVQLLTRNIKRGELIAIYDYTTDKTTKFTITKVTKISGTPTLTKGQILQNP